VSPYGWDRDQLRSGGAETASLTAPIRQPMLANGLAFDIYQKISIIRPYTVMSDTKTAKIFQHGRSQAVRLPKEFRLPGTEVRVRRVGRGVLLEPIDDRFGVKAWFNKLDEYLGEPFMPDGRQQPDMPPAREILDE
jgi:antitoxin VapB